MQPDHEKWMRIAIAAASRGVAAGQSPFGAVVVRGAELIADGHNEVWRRGEPTAHAEIVTIQNAARALHTIDLSGCVMYSTCEPCPMCAAAIHWARLDAICYGATIADAARAGFNELRVSIRELYERGRSGTRIVEGVLPTECAALFDQWLARPDHRGY